MLLSLFNPSQRRGVDRYGLAVGSGQTNAMAKPPFRSAPGKWGYDRKIGVCSGLCNSADSTFPDRQPAISADTQIGPVFKAFRTREFVWLQKWDDG